MGARLSGSYRARGEVRGGRKEVKTRKWEGRLGVEGNGRDVIRGTLNRLMNGWRVIIAARESVRRNDAKKREREGERKLRIGSDEQKQGERQCQNSLGSPSIAFNPFLTNLQTPLTPS